MTNSAANIEATIKQMISEASGLPVDKIQQNVPIIEQGVDSLAAAELIFELEDTFGVTTDPGSNFLKTATVSDLVAFVVANQK